MTNKKISKFSTSVYKA